MRTLIVLLSLLVVQTPSTAGETARLGGRLQARYAAMEEGETALILITLRDKGPRAEHSLSRAAGLLSPRSLARRARVRPLSALVDGQDLPLEAGYVAKIRDVVGKIRHELKWFNAVSAEATKSQIDALARLPFVTRIDLVGRWKVTPEPFESPPKTTDPQDRISSAHTLDYGASLTQNDQIRVTDVHDLGITGKGVMIGVFDNGVRLLSHESFATMNIVAQYDFVDHKVSVIPSNPSTAYGWHGVMTLSTIGGYKSGQLIGPAFASDYVLARTENDSSETPVEEDNWAAAIEWADSVGIDVASTSLGYLGYDSGYGSWSWEDMDGNSTLITRAADHAVSLGIVVVNSAGNEGPGNGTDNTLIAPADGDSVIAAGAVTSTGIRSSFSSVGPTTDAPPRIKPDVMAMGSGVRVASYTNPLAYFNANGTSFSCPLSAGVAALILSANPTLGPLQVRDAMRNTADNAASPNNQYGWGILDADSAIRYWGIVPMARLSGTLYHDLDADGVRDGGEPGLSGNNVVISGPTIDTVLSGAAGEFLFDSLAIGSYSLTATVPGWAVTTTPGSLGAYLLHRDSLGGFTIGLVQTGSGSGSVFNDTNSNGMRDPGEPGLAGRTVLLTGAATDSAVTDSSGAYTFTGLLPGTYSISQVQQAGWVQSAPPSSGGHPLFLSEGMNTTGLDFGNYFDPANTYGVHAGWNLLSLPVVPAYPLADSIYPNRLSPVTPFDGEYYTTDTIPAGRGYWVKFPSAENILVEGTPRTIDTLTVSAGWNLIGSLSGPTLLNAIVQSPPGNVVSHYYAFRAGSYVNADPELFLQPHEGYWVKCAGPGELILESSYQWVGKRVTGGCQCDTGCGSSIPPDSWAELTDGGIPVLATDIGYFPLCHACNCPAYDEVHYALIRSSDVPAAEVYGFTPMNP